MLQPVITVVDSGTRILGRKGSGPFCVAFFHAFAKGVPSLFPSLHRLAGRGIVAAVAAVSLAAGSAAFIPLAAQAAPATNVVGAACPPGVGVTVVVDFVKAGVTDNDPVTDRVEIGCADGPQTNGFAALANAGFTVGSGSGAGTLCTLDGLPAAGFPYCWYEGYWSYWRSNGTLPFDFAQTGAGGTGVIPVDSVEGWSFTKITDDWESFQPRIGVAELGDYRPPFTATPQAPVLTTIAANETLKFTGQSGSSLEHAVLATGTPLADAQWQSGRALPLAAYVDRDIRVVARVIGGSAPTFDATYQVRASYSPGRGLGTDANPDVSVPTADPRIKGWATGVKDYVPGPNVTENWKTPQNALGVADNSLVVLGDKGTLTLTFDRPVANKTGADFAVYENSFRVNGQGLDFIELAKIAVSSNGTDFAVFDSATQRATPVGAYAGQSAADIGGLAGRDLAGQGTPFDLSALTNHDLVRAGDLDLDHVTDVRVIDVMGDGSELDSFGRPIYDPFPSYGSGGFDLAGVAVLNQAPAAPDAPSAPSVALDGTDVTVAWEAPADGGAPVTGYVVTLTPTTGSPLTTTTGDATSATFTQVPAGTWTATVRATNVAGDSSDSASSEPVTVKAPATPQPEPTTTPTPVPVPSTMPATPIPATVPAPALVKRSTNVSVELAAKRVERNRWAVVTIKVTGADAYRPTGRVKVRYRGRVRTVEMVDGRAFLKVRVGAKTGAHKVRARYRGDKTHHGSASAVTVRVTR